MLNNHPARRFVMDFLRVIVVDSLSLPVNAKVTPAIDLVLEVSLLLRLQIYCGKDVIFSPGNPVSS